jgi:hypothetical protein
MKRRVVKLLPFLAFAAAGALLGSAARADDGESPPQPLPALPAPSSSPAPAESTLSTPAVQTVHAQQVRTNHVDTVLVAQPGSHVDVHEAPAGAAAATPTDDGGSRRPDGARKAAIIASTVSWSVGGTVTGIAYVAGHGQQHCQEVAYSGAAGAGTCSSDPATGTLVAYGSIMTVVPSIPRWVVGDVGGALAYTAARGASMALGTAVQWGSGTDGFTGPFVFAFLVPLTLGVLDLATVPERKAPAAAAPGEAHGPKLLSVAPVAVAGPDHRTTGAALEAAFRF